MKTKPPHPSQHRPRCQRTLVGTFRDGQLVSIGYEHRATGCALLGCYGRIDDLPIADWW